MESRSSTATRDFATAFAITMGVFALLGLGHRIYDVLITEYARAFTLSQSALSLTRGIYSLVYFLGAIPAALCARQMGYKTAIVIGLGCVALGVFLFYPAGEMHSFGYFLAAAGVISSGWILLEIAGNPLVVSFGHRRHGVLRLNVAQAAYPIGAIAGLLAGRWVVGAHLAMPTAHAARAIVHPYMLVGAAVVLLALLISEVRFPPSASERSRASLGGEFRQLFGSKLFCFAMVAQFFSVVCLSGTWFQSERFFLTIFPQSPYVGDIFLWAMAVYGAGRITGAVLMIWIAPERLLAGFALAGAVVVFAAGLLPGVYGFAALLASSFTLSIIWATILGLAIRDLGPAMKLGTALVCMASSAGGILFGQLQAFWQPPTLFVAAAIPAGCYLVVLGYAAAVMRSLRQREHSRAEAVIAGSPWRSPCSSMDS